jgi:hypothetical protein
MELRRLEALQNLSSGACKVIVDLARPASEVRSTAVAAALGEGRAWGPERAPGDEPASTRALPPGRGGDDDE